MANTILLTIIAIAGILGWAFFFYMSFKLIKSRQQEITLINDILKDISQIKKSIENR